MKKYAINWVDTIWGTSVVNANSEKEAMEMARNGKDSDFESSCDPSGDWEIHSAVLLDEEELI